MHLEQENQAQHKRRVRYKGKYPKKFEEKYKELQPEKYQDTVAHVISKGNTPAGMHISIMVKEILDFLEIRPGQQGLDCTLGYGGHSRKMLEKLPRGALVIDLASLPGGTDFDAAEALGIRAEHALALPGKCAPDTAGALIAQTVLTILQERGDLHDEPA